MACSRYVLTNTGTTIVTFNYRRCDDALWQNQVELNPEETKNIWLINNSYSISPYFERFVILENWGDFPPTTVTATPDVTPTPTPSQTPVVNVTPTSTPTPTYTPTSTTNRNLIISNTSSNNFIINLIDDSGIWYLTDQVGSFIVGPGQTLYANHDTTSVNPRCTITFTGTYNFQVRINGVLTSDWGGSGSGSGLQRVLRTASPSTPIDISEIVYIQITN